MTRLMGGFSVVLLAMLVMGIMGAHSIRHLAGLTGEIFQHPFTIMTSVLELKANILLQQKAMTKLAHTGKPADVTAYELASSERAAIIDSNIDLIYRRYGGDQSDIAAVAGALAKWRAARRETLELMRGGHAAEVAALTEGRDAALAEALIEQVDKLRDFETKKAESFKQSAEEEGEAAVVKIMVLLALAMAGSTVVALLIAQSIGRSLKHALVEVERVAQGSIDKARIARAISAGDLDQEIFPSPVPDIDLRNVPDDELGYLLRAAVRLGEAQNALDEAFGNMSLSLRHGRQVEEAASWLKEGLNELYACMRAEQDMSNLAYTALNYLVRRLEAAVGAIYLFDESARELRLAASFAPPAAQPLAERIPLGQGLIGQVARDRQPILLEEVPADYLRVSSALGDAVPKVVAAVPLLQGKLLVGALEIGALRPFSAIEREFLDLAREIVAVGLRANLSRLHTAELLEETQQQAEELRVQQEELQQSNEELEERAQLLEQHRARIEAKNREIEVVSDDLRQKAAELARASSYKSEFLANMSHELRTPLNSLMILSSLLKQNKEGNLTGKQIQYAETINSAGADLLNLINDILDLSKIEAGHMELGQEDIEVSGLCETVRALFAPQADRKKLELAVKVDPEVPSRFIGDRQRILQILKNLLSNAIKFTDSGQVSLRTTIPSAADNPLPTPAMAFVVSDTGIGIAPAQQQLVFQAFRQADGSISRKYGGTGLGLSISLQLAQQMQGRLSLESREGQGSVFTLYLPLLAIDLPCGAVPAPAPAQAQALPPGPNGDLFPARDDLPGPSSPIPDDRDKLKAGDRSILIIEDDIDFLGALAGTVRERGFAVLAAANGETGLALARKYQPSAIILDVILPAMNGWGVMRSLKDDPGSRHIPVHFITCLEDRKKAMAMGAIGFLTKPVDMEMLDGVFLSIEGRLAKADKHLLIVEDNREEASSMVVLLEEEDVRITVAADGREAIELLSAGGFDCLVLDLGLADMSGFELLDHIQTMEQARQIPVIVHSGRDLSQEDERRLRRYAESIIIKGAKSPERLLDEVSLFLHLVESRLNPAKQRMIRNAIDKEALLAGRTVLLVDDDIRNIFSLSSVLEEKGLTVIEAVDGGKALEKLRAHPEIDIVLMDIMMPEMDGYTAMREIRRDPQLGNLPVIAMTAKALKGDYEKCIAAGATDYITKPIEVDKLLSLIRVWLYQQVE